MGDIVAKLRAVDHTDVEDCFFQSPLYGQAADEIDALHAQVEALRDALTRLRDPAPGVKHLPPWAYGIIVPALAKSTGSPDGQQ